MGLIERIPPHLRSNPEFQSALVRIGIWLFALIYIGFGAWAGFFDVAYGPFFVLFSVYLVMNLSILFSVLRRSLWEARRYLSLSLDIIAVSLAIYLVKDGFSPFYLVYIWIFISAGTRYGRNHLAVASLAAVISYNLVLLVLGEWQRAPMNALFHTLVLVLLPLYQASLLRKLREAMAAAEHANRAKGVFLANMTHELRTPLTGVRGMADLLLSTRLDAEQRDYVDAIVASANTLHALIGDILDLSKIEAAMLQLERLRFDPRTPVKEVCDAMHTQAFTKGLEVICDIDPALPAMVCGDPLRVRQILFNLIGNAVKFTEHGEIIAHARLAPGEPGTAQVGLTRPHLLLEVADTGIGIAPDKLEEIFEDFRQADESTTRRYGGTGLGTTIARELADLMGGRIEVESALGVGSRFSVRLPLLIATDADAEPDALAAAAAPRADPPAADATPDLTGLQILVCEPNATLRGLIFTTCEGLGADCVALPEAAPAPDAATPLPDLVILGDSPAGIDLGARVATLTARLERPPAVLCLTYRQRRSQLGGPLDEQRCCCLNKPFLGQELATAIALTLALPTRPTPACCDQLTTAAATDPATVGDRPAPHQPPTRTGARNAAPPTAPASSADPVADDAPAPLPATGIRVLLAEDSSIAAAVIRTMLTKQGAAVRLVDNGRAALAAAMAGGFDLAFVDLRMPGLDGIGFTRALRTHERVAGGHLPVFALTANACCDVREQCLGAGMDGFLSKPVDHGALVSALLSYGRSIPSANVEPEARP